MAKETTYAGILGKWHQLLGAMEENIGDLPHLEPFRFRLRDMAAQALEIAKRQAALKASKQQASKELREVTIEGERLANVVRTVVKEHYGIREEKLAEFGMQPFRGRKPKPEPEPLEQESA